MTVMLYGIRKYLSGNYVLISQVFNFLLSYDLTMSKYSRRQ